MKVPQVHAPIVLVHGLFGFDQLRMGSWASIEYFRGIPKALRAAGNRVLQARLSPTGGIADRACQLQAFLDSQAAGEAVHVIAHSMGGLDARYMISRLGMAPRVLSLTTLGTPHRGSPFADWAVARFTRLIAPVFDHLRISRQAFEDLTVERCKRFNEETPDAPGVRYFSVAGRHVPSWHHLAWGLTAAVVSDAEGPNDGIVSLASAQWGETFDVWEADHLNLVNWPQPWCRPRKNDRTPQYAALLERLRDARS